MPRNWDQTLKEWAETIHATDEARGSAAQEAIRDAIRASTQLKQRRIDVLVTGSYRNQTNIRGDSDIDVAVVLRDVAFHAFPADGSVTRERLGIRDADYSFDAFRDDVGAALRERFGKDQITEGNKAFNVCRSGDRLEADVAVFLEYRRYTGKKTSTGAWEHQEGVELRSRREPEVHVVNWPQQHYDRGVAKNEATNRRFKRMVRIFKHLAADMAEQGTAEQQSAAGQVRSFGLECLVHNVPNDHFNLEEGGYLKDTRAVLTWLGKATKPSYDAPELDEVSGMEKLFRADRTREQAYAFVRAAWGRVFDKEPLPW
jgi:hypothetical protein